MKRILHLYACAVTCVLVPGTALAQTVRYVDDDAPDGGDGLTWDTPYDDLQDALTEALGDPTITEVHVAGGTYLPSGLTDPDDPRTATFQLQDELAVQGGYRGLAGGGDPDDRDIEMFETTLSGDLDGDDIPDLTGGLACFSGDGEPYEEGCESFDTDGDGDVDAEDLGIDENSYHVVTGSGTNGTAMLDGFTITCGNADHLGSFHRFGGGMYNNDGSPTLANCTFKENLARYNGGGMYNTWGSSPTLNNCFFSGNSTVDVSGAGMFNWEGSSPELTNCTFSSNVAAYDGGGVCSLWDSNPTLINCTFGGNSANHRGGGMFTYCGTAELIACTFAGNSVGDYGGGMWNGWTHATITNCVFTGNSAVSYGGGMFNWNNSSPILVNCTFAANVAANGRAIACTRDQHRWPSNVEITNCILWDGGDEVWNTDGSTITITYSDVQGGWSGEGNIDADPLFADADGPDGIPGTEDDDLHLLPGSPCIDAADNTAVPADTTDLDGDCDTTERVPVDLDGAPRFVDDPETDDTGVPDPPDYPEVVDMGAYEYADCNTNGVPDYQDIAGGTSEDCNANSVPDECEMLDVVSVCSSHLHGEAGEFCLELGVCPAYNWIEPRGAGVRELVCEMNVPVDPATASPASVQVVCANNVYEGTIGTSLGDGTYCSDAELVITFDPALPDQDCCRVTLDGMASAYGQPSVVELPVRTLIGDLNRNNLTEVGDVDVVKNYIGQPLDSGNFTADQNANGVIEVGDSEFIKNYVGHTAPDCQ